MDLPPEIRRQLAICLEHRLAMALDLHSQVTEARWNIRGPSFHGVHSVLDEVAEGLRTVCDRMAERVGALGFRPRATARSVAAHSTLPPYPEGIVRGADHIGALVERFGMTCTALRHGIIEARQAADPVTGDLFTWALGQLEGDAWRLQRHVQASGIEGDKELGPVRLVEPGDAPYAPDREVAQQEGEEPTHPPGPLAMG